MSAAKTTAIVTGGSAGIGKAIVEDLLNRDYTVISLARRKADFNHPKLISYEVDLTDAVATQQVAAEAARQNPAANIVHNAGALREALIEDVKLDDLNALVNMHMAASISLVQANLPAMKEAHFGRVLNMSTRAIVGLQRRTSYAGTKAALIAMTRTWALELGEHGVTVNAVAPGPVVTEMLTNVIPEESERAAALAKSLPAKRLGRPEDVARAVWFFLDPASDWITGQTLFVCGGASIGSLAL